jgi:hypothetical protein
VRRQAHVELDGMIDRDARVCASSSSGSRQMSSTVAGADQRVASAAACSA